VADSGGTGRAGSAGGRAGREPSGFTGRSLAAGTPLRVVSAASVSVSASPVTGNSSWDDASGALSGT